jgi:hypothetical protein
MTQKILIADPSWSASKVEEVTSLHGCCAYFLGLPQSLSGLAESQGWSVPCVIVEDIEASEIVSWTPVQ